MCLCVLVCFGSCLSVCVERRLCVAQEGMQGDICETSALIRCIVSPLTPRLCFQQSVSVEIQKDLQSQWRQLQVQHNAGSTWVYTQQSFTLCNGLSHPSVGSLHFELTLVLLWTLCTLPALLYHPYTHSMSLLPWAESDGWEFKTNSFCFMLIFHTFIHRCKKL